MHFTCEAPREGFEPPCLTTVDFESTAIPGYAISACLSVQRHSHKHDAIRRIMLIRFHGRDHDKSYDFEDSIKVRDALLKCGILPSTVVVSYQDQILPLSTIITSDIELLVTTVSSGG